MAWSIPWQMHSQLLHPFARVLQTWNHLASLSVKCSEMLWPRNYSMSPGACCIFLRTRLPVIAWQGTQSSFRNLKHLSLHLEALRQPMHSMSSHCGSRSCWSQRSLLRSPDILRLGIRLAFDYQSSKSSDQPILQLILLRLVHLSPCTRLLLHSNMNVHRVHYLLRET